MTCIGSDAIALCVRVWQYKKVLWRYAKRSRPNHRDTFRGKMGDHVVKGFADGHVDPFGINGGLADDEQPAVQAYDHHKYLAYGRKFEKEPISDMALNGWHGQHGVPPMVENSPEAEGAAAGPAGPGRCPRSPLACTLSLALLFSPLLPSLSCLCFAML